MVSYLDWSFLSIGAFFNFNHPASGYFSNTQTTLRLAEDRNYTKGRVWETFRSNWVWESGVEYASQPINISGVYVNNNYVPIGTTGSYAYTLQYPLGRVVFDSALPVATTVEMDYSCKYVNVYPADSPWFRELQFNSFRSDSPMYRQYGSGIWSVDAKHRVQLPAIFVECSPRLDIKPRALGGGEFLYQDVLLHVFTETPVERKNMMDIFTLQKEHRIAMYDKNTLASSGDFPLKVDGSLAASAKCFPVLIQNYPWRSAYICETIPQTITNTIPGLYCGVVRTTLEIIN